MCRFTINNLFFRKQIQEVNFQRKNVQMQVGEKLRDLEANWVGLVSKNYEIELACALMEKHLRGYELANKETNPERMDTK